MKVSLKMDRVRGLVCLAPLAIFTQACSTYEAPIVDQQPPPAAGSKFGPASPIIARDGHGVGNLRSASWPAGAALGMTGRLPVIGQLQIVLHSVGRCDAPAFATSGALLAGAPSPAGAVSTTGDGNLHTTILAYGTRLRATDPGNGPALLDQDGSAALFMQGGMPVACAVVR